MTGIVTPTIVKLRYDSFTLKEERFNARDIRRALKESSYIPTVEEYDNSTDCLWILLDALDCVPLNQSIEAKAQIAIRFSNGHEIRKRVKFTELGLIENGRTGLKEKL